MSPPLLAAINCTSHVHLIVGSNSLAAARCTRSLEVGAIVKLVAPTDAEIAFSLQNRIDAVEIQWVKADFGDFHLTQLGREEVDGFVDACFVTLGAEHPSSFHISMLCRRLRIPINVCDSPDLCTFTMLSTYSDGPLQIGITTSGNGCKLASRIRREVASCLPPKLGAACERLGTLRRRIWEQDHNSVAQTGLDLDEDDGGQKSTFNNLINLNDHAAKRNRRARWLAQICEYWPLQRLAEITDDEISQILLDYINSVTNHADEMDAEALELRRHRGKITLAGSGPGHPDLLTIATRKAILGADLILADKLVPAAVLKLVPRQAEVYIARKFPGNAEKAQEELLWMGLRALKAGKRVLRLKQGDPYLYGRGAEEYTFFLQHDYQPVVLPGITSALSGPLIAGIPATHRAVADQVLICTGTGRHGASPDPPEYVESRTVVFLMALHRLSGLVDSLLAVGKKWPRETPCAVIERASCPDQRIIRSSLQHISCAIEEEGSRPPGLLVAGLSCKILNQPDQRKWTVEEGFRDFDDLLPHGSADS
ncbi:MAG: hypothetical protein M1829_005266 [Trizodia sp. TS-e1964]|nr:MAG: hypothetical protein M1829_005266 [Trizodia sp. TS-e1964]